jgi:hypothetical protein
VHSATRGVAAEIVTDLLLGGADEDEGEVKDSSPSKKKKKGTPSKGAGGKKKAAAGKEDDGDTIAVAVKSEGAEQDGEVCGVYGEACGC